MVNVLRKVSLAAFALFLTLLSTSVVQAQLCGQSFAQFTVTDSEGKSVPDVTVELLAELPDKDFKEFKIKKGYDEYGSFNFKLSRQDAKELLKRSIALSTTTDVCGNPFKQRSNSTRVKTSDDFMSERGASVKNFGFCALEHNRQVILLKLSAHGYPTGYYLGSYLRGCIHAYSFVLSKTGKEKVKT
jgi:hypothetical protein